MGIYLNINSQPWSAILDWPHEREGVYGIPDKSRLLCTGVVEFVRNIV